MRFQPVLVAHPLGENLEVGDDAFAGFLAHDVADADPVVEFVRRDHRKDLDAATRMFCP